MEIGGGLPAGAEAAAHRLAAAGVGGLVSFGLAGGLDPALRPGAVVIPEIVLSDGCRFAADPALSHRLGAFNAVTLLAAARAVADAAEKSRLWHATGAVAVDLESGAVARVAASLGLPFAVLRAVCDPAEATLPPAALAALDADGAIGLWRVLGSLARHPGQLPALLRLAADAAAARRALLRSVVLTSELPAS